jgi:Glycosyl transferase family 2
MTLVSIVTPTFPDRWHLLSSRCNPSVMQQSWGEELEHVIVSDRNLDRLGVDFPVLFFGQDVWGKDRYTRITQINESWRNPVTEASIGAIPWYIGSLLALGDYIGFLGDDDEYLPDHVARHIATMEETGADFTVSQVDFRVGGNPYLVIGDESFQLGHLDSDGIMCRASALAVANWSASPHDSAACDYRLVRDWLNGGLKGAIVPGGPTAIHHDGWAAGKTGRPDRPR